MSVEPVTGYFTIERHLIGADVAEISEKLGFPSNYLLNGARVLVLLEQPKVGQFVFAGSTWYPDAQGLVSLARRANFPIPGAWAGQRLVKIAPIVRSLGHFPRARTPVEQWQLVEPVNAREVERLFGTRKYSPR